jgi:hypothetical protein
VATAEWRLDEVWLTAVADPSVAGAPEHDPPRRRPFSTERHAAAVIPAAVENNLLGPFCYMVPIPT